MASLTFGTPVTSISSGDQCCHLLYCKTLELTDNTVKETMKYTGVKYKQNRNWSVPRVIGKSSRLKSGHFPDKSRFKMPATSARFTSQRAYAVLAAAGTANFTYDRLRLGIARRRLLTYNAPGKHRETHVCFAFSPAALNSGGLTILPE